VFGPAGIHSPNPEQGLISSLAVLPFESASGDPDSEFLGEGIAESVINRMTSIGQLRVIPRNTAFLFRGRNTELDQVARELKVQAILTGRVIRRGDRLIISVTLEDVPGSQQLWGERFDENQDNILQIEARIADRIADALSLQLTGEQRSRLAQSGTAKPAAHLACLKGRFFRRQETAEGVRQAIVAFERAIDLDPSFRRPSKRSRN
jgi:adenylate cyclase